jgi:hypothetical protein
MYERCNHKHKDTVIHNFLLMSEKCIKTVKIQSERLARMVAAYL